MSRCTRLTEANAAHAIAEVVRAADDIDFHAHEQNRQVAPVQFRKPHGVFLRGDDEFRLTFLAAIDGVETAGVAGAGTFRTRRRLPNHTLPDRVTPSNEEWL